MAITIAQDAVVAQVKGSGIVSATCTGATAGAIGDVMLAWITFDNLTATTPTISSISKTAGSTETGAWQKIISVDSPVAAAGGGIRGELWALPLVNGTFAAGNFTISWTGGIAAEVHGFARISGANWASRVTATAVAGAGGARIPITVDDYCLAIWGFESNTSVGLTFVYPSSILPTFTSVFTTGGGATANVTQTRVSGIATGSDTTGDFDSTTLGDGVIFVIGMPPAATGPVTHQVSGTVSVTTAATGNATRVPIVHQASGSVVVNTVASGAATVFVAPVVHQVTGVVPVLTAVAGDAKISDCGWPSAWPPLGQGWCALSVVHQVSGTVPVSTAATGAVSLRQPVSGTVPVVVGASGTVSAQLRASGTVPVVTTATGNATRVAIVHQVSGTVAVVTTATGSVITSPKPVSGTVAVVTTVTGTVSQRLTVAGTVPVVTSASGNATRVPVTLQVSGTVAVQTAVSGTATARLQASGTVSVVTTVTGAATRVAQVFQVSGTVPVVTTVTGNAIPPGGMQGTVPVITTVTGSVSSRQGVSGSVAVTTGVSGAVTARLRAAGAVPITVGVSGSITQVHQVSGTVQVTTGVAGEVSANFWVSGTVVVLTTVTGTILSPELPPFPCGDLDLYPSGPSLSLAGSVPHITLRGEGYPVTMTLEGVC